MGNVHASKSLEFAAASRLSRLTDSARRTIIPDTLHPVLNPADRRERVGEVVIAPTPTDVAHAFHSAARAQPRWTPRPPMNGLTLSSAPQAPLSADVIGSYLFLSENRARLWRMQSPKCAKTDFCRYYAAEARRLFAAPAIWTVPQASLIN